MVCEMVQVISRNIELKIYVTQTLRESEAIKSIFKMGIWNFCQAWCLSADTSASSSDSYNPHPR